MDNIQTELFLQNIRDIDKRVSHMERTTQQQLIDWYAMNPSLFTYQANNVITVDSNLEVETLFAIGDHLRITQTTVKYFYITWVDTATNRIYLLGGDAATFTNGAFTAVALNKQASASGFPAMTYTVPNTYVTTGGGQSEYDFDIVQEISISMVGRVVNLYWDLQTSSLPAGTLYVDVPLPFVQTTVEGKLSSSVGSNPLATDTAGTTTFLHSVYLAAPGFPTAYAINIAPTSSLAFATGYQVMDSTEVFSL